MPTYDIPSFEDFVDGESSTVRAKLNDNFDKAEEQLQGVEDRLEESLTALHVDGGIWKGPGDVADLIVSAGEGLSVNVSAGEALIGYRLQTTGFSNNAGNGITNNATNYCYLQQDGSLYFSDQWPVAGGQRKILLATVTTAGGVVTAVNNYADGVIRGVGQPSLRSFVCDAQCAVRDAVYVSGANTVAQAQSDDGAPAKARAIGIILAKETESSCIVATDGSLVGGFTGLSTGSAYYLQTTAGELGTGKPTPTDPIVPVGIAVSTTAMLVKIFLDEVQIGGGGALPPHAAQHETGGSDALTNLLDANARVGVGRNSQGITMWRRGLNLIEGTGVSIAIEEDAGDEEIDVSIASSGTAAHASSHAAGGSDVLDLSTMQGQITAQQHGVLAAAEADHTGNLGGNARVGIRKNSGGTTYKRRRLNLIEGANVTLTVADDAVDEEVDITIDSAGGGGGGAPTNASYVTMDSESKLSNEYVLGTAVVMKGTLAARPAASKAGRLYYVTDAGDQRWTRDTGSAWEDMTTDWDYVGSPALPYIRNEIIVVVAGTLTTGTPKPGFMIAPAALTVEAVEVEVDTAPTGANLIVDIHKILAADKASDQTGTTIYTTQGNRPTITAGSKYANATLPDVTAIAQGDVLRVGIDQVGSTVAGSDLTVCVRVKQQAGWS